MRMGLIIVGIIILAAAGYFLFVQPAEAPTTETPNDTMGTKININAVCEGALAYMTFENGAAAEAWVQECKEGKHPQAIEQWKVQMGIQDDRAI